MIPDWRSLVLLDDEHLGKYDVAEVNLACAMGLPGGPTERQAAECLDRLDHYARCAADYTDKRLPEFRAQPEFYRGSESIFRIVCLVTLTRIQGIVYHPEKRAEDAVLDTPDKFIHGALLGEGGTCASLPVMYTAIGRRMGYPLKLAATWQHAFFRWDEPGGERFNIEANGIGMDVLPDDYYRQGKYAGPPGCHEACQFLRSQTPQEELASFLNERGLLFRDCQRYKEACESLIWATACAPKDLLMQEGVKSLLHLWEQTLHNILPPTFPQVTVRHAPRRYPANIPMKIEQRALFLELLEQQLTDPVLEKKWWGPLRRGERVRVPSHITCTVGM